ncbi:hypothetical protein B7463_g6998, partial [Scytalidium lignicola]
MVMPQFLVLARVVGADGAFAKWKERLAALCAVSETEPYSTSYYWGQDVDGEPDTLWGLEGYAHPVGFFLGHVSTDIFKHEMKKVDDDKLLRHVQGLNSPDYDLHHYDLFSGFLKRGDDSERDTKDSFVVIVHIWALDGKRKQLLGTLAGYADQVKASEKVPSIKVQSFGVLKEIRDVNLASLYIRTRSREDWEAFQSSLLFNELLHDIKPLICAATLASFNYGYSNNVIAGTLAQVTFISKFLSGDNAESLIDAIISGFFGCALIGAFGQAYISNRWGRKSANGVAAVLLIIGNALQAGAVKIPMFLVGRYITGFGAGMIISNTPVYLSEVSPAHSRGLLVGLQGNFIVLGYIISSCAALGFHFVDKSYQWRLNFIISTFFACALLLSLIALPESPRWLVEHGRREEAGKILNRIHKTPDDPDGRIAHAELVQIVAQVELDRKFPSSWSFILSTKSMRKRLICTLLVWSMAQATGITVLANLTPRLFSALGYGTVLQLGLSLVWTVCLFVGCFVNITLIDKIGRVKLIVAGGWGMVILLAVEAALQHFYLDGSNLDGTRGAVAIYFIVAAWFTSTLECTGYVYGCEIWPTHLRSKGSAISYFGFYVFSIWSTAPAAQAFGSIGWKYYMVFISVTVVLLIPCMLYLPETSGISLEELGAKFGDNVAIDFEHALHEDDKSADHTEEVASEKVSTV